MTGHQRRAQLLDVGRELLAEKGYDATSIEEVAKRAAVSKPIVYEHFGGKEGLYLAVVEREMQSLLARLTEALGGAARQPKALLEQAAAELLAYIEEVPDGFRVLVHDSPVASASGTYASLLGKVSAQVEAILTGELERNRYDPELAGLYARGLVGMVAQVGEWWLDTKRPDRNEVAAHLVNLAWNGLAHLERKPRLPAVRPSVSKPARARG